ncbi:MAG: flagellar assembly protein FliW [bacterium]|nr:flagellar assembly protein FliW [bacterium]
MKFHTTRFGEIEYPEEVVIDFPEGVLGFPADTRYILLEHDAAGSPFKWLQSLDNPELAFIVVDPNVADSHYRFDLDVDTARLIGTADAGNCAAICIVNVPRDAPIRMTANLKAPLVINADSRVGRQVVLGTQAYAINTPIFTEMIESERGAYRYVGQEAVG